MKTIDHAVTPENDLDEFVLHEAFKGYFRDKEIIPYRGAEIRLELQRYLGQGWFEIAAHPRYDLSYPRPETPGTYLVQMLWKKEFHLKPVFRTKIEDDPAGVFQNPPGTIDEGLFKMPEFA